MDEVIIWTFYKECEIPQDLLDQLIDGELPVASYKTIRDIALFTNKRLIVRDSQGITGKKIESYSLPYSSINMYSIENAGKFLDFNAEVELWTKAGKIKISVNPDADINKIDRILAQAILK